MIFAHPIIGLLPVAHGKFSWFWLIGSVIPDVDHLVVLYQHKIFSWPKIREAMANEEKHHLRFKTKWGHSLLGALAASAIVSVISFSGAAVFFLAYVLHLLFDWPDKDIKYYLYPLDIKFKGFLPIFSNWEIIFTFGLLIALIKVYV